MFEIILLRTNLRQYTVIFGVRHFSLMRCVEWSLSFNLSGPQSSLWKSDIDNAYLTHWLEGFREEVSGRKSVEQIAYCLGEKTLDPDCCVSNTALPLISCANLDTLVNHSVLQFFFSFLQRDNNSILKRDNSNVCSPLPSYVACVPIGTQNFQKASMCLIAKYD